MAIGSPQWMYASGEAYTVDQSLKFDNDQSLTRTPASASNRKTFTFSAWVKVTTPDKSTRNQIFCAGTAGSANDSILVLNGSDNFAYLGDSAGDGSWTLIMKTDALVRDPSAWYHIVYAIDTTQSTASNRGKIYINGNLASLSDYTAPSQNADLNFNNTIQHWIGDGADTNGDFDGYLSEVNFIDGQALTPSDFGETGDYGEWKPKEYSGTYGTNGFYLPFKNDYTVEGFSTVTYKGTGAGSYIGGVGFKSDFTWIKNRGSSGENHSLYDAVRGAGNPLYSNLTSAEATANHLTFKNDGFTLNTDNNVYSGNTYVAWNWDMGADTPTGFGCVTWNGTTDYSRNIGGFNFDPDLVWIKSRSDAYEFLHFDTLRGAGKRLMSHNSNAESTNTATLNKFIPDGFTLGSGSGVDLSVNGNTSKTYVAWGWDMGGTTVTNTTGTITSTVRANPTYGQSIISWTGTGATGTVGTGLTSDAEVVIVKNRDTTDNWSYSDTVQGGGTVRGGYLNSTAVINDTDWSSRVDPSASTANTIGVYNWDDGNKSGSNMIAYAFHSVSGYSKIGSYSGTGSSQSISLGFRPAFVMVKRTNEAHNWYIFDATRNPLGQFSDNLLADSSNAEGSNNVLGTITDTGFTLVNDNGFCNESGDSYIYMAFAGGMDSISDYNTDGSSDSRVKANTTYGQSIVSWTMPSSGSTTVGHGLNSTPELIIQKRRDSTSNWSVYTATTGKDKKLLLHDTAASANSGDWDNTAPTSSLFTSWLVNGTADMIAYCFHSVTGYSKIGSYSGTGGSHTLTFGFRPAFIMIKKSSDSGSGWMMLDTTRSPVILNKYLEANSSGAEGDATFGTVTDTGFDITGTFGSLNTNGETYIYMAFADKREYAYWLDQSGNNNDWTSNNLTESDISVDSPTNNFATLNPLSFFGANSLVEGNLQIKDETTNHRANSGTMFSSSGKWYFEALVKTSLAGSTVAGAIGLQDNSNLVDYASGSDNYVYYCNNNSARLHFNGNGTGSRTLSTDGTHRAAGGDILQCAYDVDTRKLFIGLNNSWIANDGDFDGNPATGDNPTNTLPTGIDFLPYIGSYNNVITANFGQDSSFAGNKTAQGYQDSNEIGDFYYEPPTGFLALCTDNLPDVAVVPSEHFNTVLWAGTGSSNAISVGFQPDFVWLKARDYTYSNILQDSVRGAGKELRSNATLAEVDRANSLTSFDSNGFTVTTDAAYNNSGNNYVAWNWKANGSGSSNTDGDVTSTVSANVDAGFSIVTYTGNGSNIDVGHGLSKAPEIVIVKVRNETGGWYANVKNIPSQSAGADMVARLDSTTAINGYNVGQWYFGSQAPTSSVFRVQNKDDVGENGDTHVAYCFHSVDGYSKVGSYTGNGNADGTFVYTGFRPAYVMIKNADSSGTHWIIWDKNRNGYNDDNAPLYANLSNGEGSGGSVDLVSNGFKLRTTSSQRNENNSEFIYLAFAETPFKYSNGR